MYSSSSAADSQPLLSSGQSVELFMSSSAPLEHCGQLGPSGQSSSSTSSFGAKQPGSLGLGRPFRRKNGVKTKPAKRLR